MKRIISLLVLIALTIITALAFAADPPATAAAVPVPSTSFMAWFSVNENAILKFALSVSEFLGVFTMFKGNGILDSIVKGLKALSPAAATTDQAQ